MKTNRRVTLWITPVYGSFLFATCGLAVLLPGISSSVQHCILILPWSALSPTHSIPRIPRAVFALNGFCAQGTFSQSVVTCFVFWSDVEELWSESVSLCVWLLDLKVLAGLSNWGTKLWCDLYNQSQLVTTPATNFSWAICSFRSVHNFE